MDTSGKVVQPHTPHFLQAARHGRPPRRTGSTWRSGSSSRDNPLTARVVVNRLWKLYFGIGLSKVLIDMGSQGEVPPNQELLDWLAVEFMDSGWDMKHMVRLMVTSQRLSPVVAAAAGARRDRSRQSARRPAVAVPARGRADSRQRARRERPVGAARSAATSCGRISRRGITRRSTFPERDYTASTGDDQFRRAVYVHWQRQFLHPGCWRSTRRRARNARPTGRSPTRRPPRWCC